MLLSDYNEIRFGKDDKEALSERTDIIYRIYLGDRQVWKRNEQEEEIKTEIDTDDIKLIWNIEIEKDTEILFWLNGITDVTIVEGFIDWGDGQVEAWRSGQNYKHIYNLIKTSPETTETKNIIIILKCAKKYLSECKIITNHIKRLEAEEGAPNSIIIKINNVETEVKNYESFCILPASVLAQSN